jgi:hypothetical protein
LGLTKVITERARSEESSLPPVSLTDQEFTAVRAAAAAVPYAGRDEFLRPVAAEPGRQPPTTIGVGLIARVVRDLKLEREFRLEWRSAVRRAREAVQLIFCQRKSSRNNRQAILNSD